MPLELFTSETGIHACACGSEHLAIVSLDGEVYTWGRKGGGRLGLPDDKIMGGKVQTLFRNSFEPCQHNSKISVQVKRWCSLTFEWLFFQIFEKSDVFF